MPQDPRFDRLLAEGESVPVAGWDFSWLRTVVNDVGAVVYFLRKVLWTVPGFTVAGYRDQLCRLHETIQAEGPFVAHAQRSLIEARKP